MVAADLSGFSAFIVDDVPGNVPPPMGDFDGRLRSAPPRRHSRQQRDQKAFFLVRVRPRTLRQNPAQISVAFPHAARKPLTGAFVSFSIRGNEIAPKSVSRPAG